MWRMASSSVSEQQQQQLKLGQETRRIAWEPGGAGDNRAELLKRTDTQTHVRAKFSRICAKFKLLNAELAKQALFHIFGTI